MTRPSASQLTGCLANYCAAKPLAELRPTRSAGVQWLFFRKMTSGRQSGHASLARCRVPPISRQAARAVPSEEQGPGRGLRVLPEARPRTGGVGGQKPRDAGLGAVAVQPRPPPSRRTPVQASPSQPPAGETTAAAAPPPRRPTAAPMRRKTAWGGSRLPASARGRTRSRSCSIWLASRARSPCAARAPARGRGSLLTRTGSSSRRGSGTATGAGKLRSQLVRHPSRKLAIAISSASGTMAPAHRARRAASVGHARPLARRPALDPAARPPRLLGARPRDQRLCLRAGEAR